MAIAAIEVAELSRTFGSYRALEGVSFSVDQGAMIALIGASGSGKSTLLRHLSGFIGSDPGRGTVRVFGREVQRHGRISPRIRSIRAEIGFVFQQFNLVGRLSVMTNVLVGLLHQTKLWRALLMRFSLAERQRALEALTAVGMEQFAWQRANTLSGGQQQRAALARCLVQGAKVILADEPIASLDPESARNVMELLAQINRERGCTVLVSLHQVDFAFCYCPRTIALHQGRIVYDGPTEALTPQLLCELYCSAATELFEGRNHGTAPPPGPALRVVAQA